MITSDHGKSLDVKRAVRTIYISGNPDLNSSGQISPQEQRLLKTEWTHLPRLQMSLLRQDYRIEWNNVENIKSILHIERVITAFLATDIKCLCCYACPGIESSCKTHFLLQYSQQSLVKTALGHLAKAIASSECLTVRNIHRSLFI